MNTSEDLNITLISEECSCARRIMLYMAVSLIGLIILSGTVGNFLVILAVKTSDKLQNVSNAFVVNLSVCDLLFVTAVLPFNLYTYLVDGWFLDDRLCQFIGFLGYTLTGTTLCNITLIAWNRYQLITNLSGYKKKFNTFRTFMMISLTWLVPVFLLVPALLGIWGKFGFVAMLVTCNLMLNHESQSFKLFLLIVRAAIPCILIAYFYLCIYSTTTKSSKKIQKTSSFSSLLGKIKQRQEMHLTRMVIVIFVIFVISYFPCTITGIIDWNTVLSKNFHMFCQITVYIGSAMNPVVYGLMNPQYRNAYLRLLTCKSKEKSPIKPSLLYSIQPVIDSPRISLLVERNEELDTESQ